MQVGDLGTHLLGKGRKAKGSARRLGPPRSSILYVALLLAALGACLAPSSALASHPFLEFFGSAEEPTSESPAGMAVDQSNGDVLVIDTIEGKVYRYKEDGTADNFAALGTNVIDGKPGGADETPQGALQFPSAFQSQIAIDNSGGETDGNIYLTQNFFNEAEEEVEHLVDIFDSEGNFLGALTEFKEGPNAEGSLTPFPGEPYGVAVDSEGNVYVSELFEFATGEIHKYEPTGAIPVNGDNTLNFSAGAPATIAAGAGPSAGSLFVLTFIGKLSKFNSTTGAEDYEVDPGPFGAVTVDPTSGHVYASRFLGEGGEIVEFDASGSSPKEVSPGIPLASLGLGVAANGSTGHIYVARTSEEKIEVFTTSPGVTSVSPSKGPTAGGNTVTIEGTNFAEATKVKFGTIGVNAPFISNTPTKIEVEAPAHAVGTVDVTVITAGGESSTGKADKYTYVGPPTVTGVNPTKGLTTGGNVVEVTGTKLTEATKVEFGTTEASIKSNTSTKIEVEAPAHAAGTVDVTVTTAGGPSANTAADDYTYELPTHTLTINNAGTGSGSVTCNGGACTSSYKEGTSVTLAAVAAPGSTFAGWSGGGCSGTGTCVVTINADTTVTATFNVIPPPAETCKVPKLKGLSLRKARSALTRAHCKTGKVTKPKGAKGKLVVKSSSPSAGKVLPAGSKVNLKLRPKRKK
jgi:IPT/TIG domain/Divergent InlB B-repeat domain/PASTA domain